MKIVRYEINWVTESGKHSLCFGESPEDTAERAALYAKLEKRSVGSDSSVFLLQVRKVTSETSETNFFID
jgi:hypothetical protein